MNKLVAMMTLPIVIGACACNGGSMAEVTEADLQQHNWTLIQIDGQDLTPSARQKSPRLKLDKEMRATGHAGCNNFFGQAQLNDNQLMLKNMGMSQKMCFGDVMKTEKILSRLLSDWSDITLSEEYLELDNGTHTLTFKMND